MALSAILLLTFSTTLLACASETPTADFSYTEKGTTVEFKDNSTGIINVVDWYWDFGDGTHSIAQNPTHVYPGYGQFSVHYRIVSSTGVVSEKSRMVQLERTAGHEPVKLAFYIPLFIIIIGLAGILFSTQDTGRIISAVVVMVGIIGLIYGGVS